MKKILLGLSLLLLASNSFADCGQAYEDASSARYVRNAGIASGIVIVTIGAVTYGAGAPIAAFLINGAIFGSIAPSFVLVPEETGIRNKFDRLYQTFITLQKNQSNAQLEKIISGAIDKADLEENSQNVIIAKDILLTAYQDQTFCPMVKVARSGKVMRAVLTQKSIINYLSQRLKA